MPADRDDRACLWNMMRVARAVQRFVEERTFEGYLPDLMRPRAVERQLEIIGEAAQRVSTPFQDAHPEIPWRPILGYDLDPQGSRLLVNPDEAAQVRAIFQLYLDYERLMPVVEELRRRG